MPSSPAFTGVYPILATPFAPDQTPDLESFHRLVSFMADIGMDGITILGVLGESNRLVDREREALIRCAVDAAAGRLPVVVGTSHSGSLAAAELSRMAEELGAEAVMVTPAAEPVPNEQRIFDYYATVARSIGIPIVVQDHPASTAVHMSVPLLLRIVNEIPSVACFKEEAVPTPPKIAALLDGMKHGRVVPILTGLGALYGGFDLERGSSGFNTGFAFPEVLQAMVRAARSQSWDRAWALYTRFLPLIVFEQQPGVAVRKEILRRRGLLAHATVRHPGASIDPATSRQLDALLARILPEVDLSRPLQL